MTDDNKDLIPVEKVNPVELFVNGGLDNLLALISAEVACLTPDVDSVRGRAEIASVAYKVSRSKVVIDEAGKVLVSEWKEKSKVVDSERKRARDALDALRDEARWPLTEWEQEKERISKEEAARKELEDAEGDAHVEHAIWLREKALAEKEIIIAAEQAERERIESEKRVAEERVQREETIRREAEATARREADESIAKEKERAERAEADAAQAAKDAERKANEAEAQAEREQQNAIQREKDAAKAEADRKDRDRLRLIEDNEREAQRRAADQENRRAVNNEAVAGLVAGGLSDDHAKTVVRLVASAKVPNMTIRY